MVLDILIRYKDPNRANGYCPFSVQDYARKYWRPIAEKLKLEMLQQLECLVIAKKEDAGSLAQEILAVRRYLQGPNGLTIPEDDRMYLLKRIDGALLTIEGSIAEWDAVKELSI